MTFPSKNILCLLIRTLARHLSINSRLDLIHTFQFVFHYVMKENYTKERKLMSTKGKWKQQACWVNTVSFHVRFRHLKSHWIRILRYSNFIQTINHRTLSQYNRKPSSMNCQKFVFFFQLTEKRRKKNVDEKFD